MVQWREDKALSRGFTLAEMLVALTLVGLIFVMVFGGLRFGTRSWDRVSDVSRDRDRVVATQMFLRTRLAASAVSNPLTMAAGRSAWEFQGEGRHLEFSAPWLSYLSVGGVYRFSLQLSGDDGSGELVISWQPAVGPQEGQDLGEIAGDRVLLDGVETFQLAYFGAVESDVERAWRSDWPKDAQLPELVRIDVGFRDPGREWPPLIVRLSQ